MKNIYSLLIVTFLLTSCCEKYDKTTYEYSGVKIIRIDECSKSTFYYQSVENISVGKIWAEYSGMNDGFKGYLKFDKSGKATIFSGDGYFQVKNLDTTLFNYKRISAYNRPKNGENVCEIMLATRYEKEINEKNKSEIKVSYD